MWTFKVPASTPAYSLAAMASHRESQVCPTELSFGFTGFLRRPPDAFLTGKLLRWSKAHSQVACACSHGGLSLLPGSDLQRETGHTRGQAGTCCHRAGFPTALLRIFEGQKPQLQGP